ncbi:hypothetical protein PG1C_00745 [Rugosibacter aromaticivorans]|uniref:Antitoxin n=2 Tax=Rugosibacter aromaticivorans TaxID=1565605 RepID=A0A0C5J5V0_9PROT|nr:hypothetical protein PG1C_00745 [Rugosibacter aromaticivorans]
MRTTLTIEDALACQLKKRAQEAGKPFKPVINENLLTELQQKAVRKSTSPAYRLKPASLGVPLASINLDKALHLADELEDISLRANLEQRK